MNIGKVAQLTGLSVKQIRDYEKAGLITPHARSDNGYRTYGNKEIDRLQFIAHARMVGFSLSQIAKLLALQDASVIDSQQVKALTGRHIDDLTNKIKELEKMKATLERWHQACQGSGEQCAILESLQALPKSEP